MVYVGTMARIDPYTGIWVAVVAYLLMAWVTLSKSPGWDY